MTKKIFYIDRFTFYATKIFEDLAKIILNDPNFEIFFIGPHKKNDNTWLSANDTNNSKRIWNFAHYVRKLYFYIKHEKPDISHFSFEWRMFGPLYATLKFPLLLFLLRVGTSTKIIVNLHALLISKYSGTWQIAGDITPSKIPKPLFSIFLKFFIKIICILSHKIIVDTPNSKLGLIEFFGINKQKIIVNDLFIPPAKFASTTEKKLNFLKQFHDKKIILCFGVISPRKSLDVIIQAFAKISEKIPDHLLVIAGLTTPDFNNYKIMLQELTKKLQIQDNVVFTGFVDDENSETLFEIADMALYLYYPVPDISGAIFPAIYHGTPCIVSEGEYFSYLFSENDVIFTKYDDKNQLSKKILDLVIIPELKNTLKENMKILSDKIHKQPTANEYYKLYRSIF